MNLLNILKPKLFTILAGLLLALAPAIAPAFAAGPISYTQTIKPDADISFQITAGNVKFETWKHDKIHISGTLCTGCHNVIQKTAGGLDIRIVRPSGEYHGPGSRLVVQLPASVHLRVNTVSADIDASGLSGRVKLDSVSGEIKLHSTSPDISAKSVSGDIDIKGSAPNASIHAHSISGEVDIKNVHGELRGETVSGDIEIDGSNTLSGAKLDTTSGDIEVSAALGGDGDYEFNSVSGDVKLRLPAVPAASFDASSLSGGITTNFGPSPQRTSEYGPGKEWHYQSGSGKAEVRIHTMSGDIRIYANHS